MSTGPYVGERAAQWTDARTWVWSCSHRHAARVCPGYGIHVAGTVVRYSSAEEAVAGLMEHYARDHPGATRPRPDIWTLDRRAALANR